VVQRPSRSYPFGAAGKVKGRDALGAAPDFVPTE
jgi:hypothetical protein